MSAQAPTTFEVVSVKANRSGANQVTVSVEPAMSKGPATAKVTIVEFSDYQ